PAEPQPGSLRAPDRRSALGSISELLQRHELAVVALVSLAVLLPGLWAYQLIDPWETHYGEVARRMLQDDDWIHLKWQNEIFRSKPVLTFWLIAAGMGSMGVATDGGYPGELVTSDLAVFAVRLPFALLGAFGLVMTWWMLARLVSRRVAWLAFAIIATCPFYCLVARQAITDMPLVAALMGAVACFAMATHAGDEPLTPFLRRGRLRLDARHVFFACLGLFTLWQVLYAAFYFHATPKLAPGLRVWQPGLILAGGMLLLFAGLTAWTFLSSRPRTRGQVWMFWFYLLIGASVLGKGPPGIGLAGAICLFYLILTGRWRLLARVEIPRGILITALVAVPWHLAMWFKDGRAWAREYFIYHMLDRVAEGVHGDKGTFDYYSSIVGVGMWPWIALLPAALAAVVVRRLDLGNRPGQRPDQIRLLVGIWAIVGAALFAITKTKFHHYMLPVVPALAILIAFWLDDVLSGRGGRVTLAALFGVALSLLVTRDLLGEPKQLIELFIYRYDRPWPGGAPWYVDVSGPILVFGFLAAAALLVFALPWRRTRVAGVIGLIATSLGFSLWASNGYMSEAAPHWGQRELHRTYYRLRHIHGLEIKYWSLRDLADHWGEGAEPIEVESVLPDGFRAGLPMTVRLLVPGAGIPGDKIEMRGQVAAVGDDRFSIAVPPAERARLADLVARGRKQSRGKARRPWIQVDADRLIAWQLNWRGENFWSTGDIYGETEDSRTVFDTTGRDKKPFLDYLEAPSRQGRTFFLITEAGRAASLESLLPTARARDTVETLDTSCNKFTLLRFVL
ncbi:MAG TPA: glycosyltransferase family 39 protein, partial [Kofleriaceae bacterium]|nr:glycosyltransferase family 39 protein [Kofleriaceae bacterium]